MRELRRVEATRPIHTPTTNAELWVLPTRRQLYKAIPAMLAESERLARNLSRWILGLGIAITLIPFLAVLANESADDDAATAFVIGGVMFFFAGVLPALAARAFFTGLGGRAPVSELVRHGNIYPARVIRRDLQSMVGGASHIVVAWRDSQRERRAHVNVARLEDQIAPGTAIVATAKRDRVGVYINGKLFLAARVE